MGFGMQKWIYTMRPRKFHTYQEDHAGHEIMGYKKHKNMDPALVEHELKVLDERIEKSIKESAIGFRTRLVLGLILFLAVVSILFFTLRS